eukprot:scaffold247983_cov37-Prasinocladus_malaysianus.AAC.1
MVPTLTDAQTDGDIDSGNWKSFRNCGEPGWPLGTCQKLLEVAAIMAAVRADEGLKCLLCPLIARGGRHKELVG